MHTLTFTHTHFAPLSLISLTMPFREQHLQQRIQEVWNSMLLSHPFMYFIQIIRLYLIVTCHFPHFAKAFLLFVLSCVFSARFLRCLVWIGMAAGWHYLYTNYNYTLWKSLFISLINSSCCVYICLCWCHFWIMFKIID